MATRKPKQSATILIVEDEQSLSDAYVMILENEGYKVAAAYDGQQALDYLKKNTPDLILLDLRMPVMDGLEFLETAKLSERLPNLPIVVFSNYDVQKEIDAAYELGATRYILKAWAAPKELVQVVQQSLEDAKNAK